MNDKTHSKLCRSLRPLLIFFIPLIHGCGENGGGTTGAKNSKQLYRMCVACHSMVPGRHLTGPSLSGIWGRKAGTAEGFTRYSDALKSSEIVWTAETMGAWLKNPQELIPGNQMMFEGVQDRQVREELVAKLKMKMTALPYERGSSQVDRQTTPNGGGMMRGGMMGGGMMSGRPLDLKRVDPARQVAAIRHCGDTFHITTVSGENTEFWEYNLRLKIDSSDKGPPKGKPALIPAGMRGDRANLIFSNVQEISTFIKADC